MKKLFIFLHQRAKRIFTLLFFFISLGTYAQVCDVTLRNDSLIDANNLIVDIYVKSTSGSFYYSGGQYKVTYNKTSIEDNGKITVSIVPGFSDLTNSSQIPTAVKTSNSSSWRIVAEEFPSTQAACSQISDIGNGTRICRVKLTNTDPFGVFSAGMLLTIVGPNATAVWYSAINGRANDATVTMVNTNLVNPILNGPITTFNVTGNGTTPSTVGLDDSQTGGVNYVLYKGSTPQGPAVDGTGSAITFGSQTEGTYTVKAHRIATYMYSDMSGNAIVTLAPGTKTLNLSSVMLQGLYIGGGTMQRVNNGTAPVFADPLIADQITVELHNTTYSSIAYTITNVNLSTTGIATITIPAIYNGSYYITIKHRNHIETTTASLVSFGGSTINYAYNLPSKVYGGNLNLMIGPGTHYAIYGGDSNGDGVADGLDLITVENGATLFLTGYILLDLNGDGSVDAFDLILAENNALNFVAATHP